MLGFVFRTGKAIPIAPRKEDAALYEHAYDACRTRLDEGELVGIFPEGRITETASCIRSRAGS